LNRLGPLHDRKTSLSPSIAVLPESDFIHWLLDQQHLKDVAKGYNVQIDNRLDAHRENQTGRAIHPPGAEPERGSAIPLRPARGPNRYAELIGQQKYDERAKQAEPNRENEQELARQRQRGPQR
jgi:hypothetical protein